MDALHAVADRLAIHELFATYAHTYDQGRLDDLADLWTEDAVFEIRGSIGSMPTVMEGRDQVVAHMRARHEATRPVQRRHVITNVVVESLDGDTATAAATLLLGSTLDGSLSLPVTGRYEDELARVDGRWRIRRQVLTLDAPLG